MVFQAIHEHYSTELICSDGEHIPIAFNHTKFAGENGSFRGGIVFVTDKRDAIATEKKLKEATLDNAALRDQLAMQEPDIALKEKKKLEQDVKDANEFLESVLESCGDGIFIADGAGIITRVNEAFAAMLGKNKKEFEGMQTSELGPWKGGAFKSTTGEMITLDQKYNDHLSAQLGKLMALDTGSKLENWEFYAFNNKRELVPLEMTASIRKDAEGVVTGSVVTARDITEKKKAEQQLREAYQFRNSFFTNITHEFRTPLTLALGPMEEILRGEHGKVSSRIKEQIIVTLRNSRQLLKLVNQLLDFSRMESGKKNSVCETKDLGTFTAAVLESFVHIAKKKAVELTFNPGGEIPRVAVDPGSLEKVLFNLIGNAFKFAQAHGHITVGLERVRMHGNNPWPDETVIVRNDSDTLSGGFKGDFVKLSISDTGIGVKKSNLKKIFDRFKQAGESFALEQGGTGIGLAHARELVDLMGGFMTVKSEPGKGSTFAVYLPAADAPVAAGNAADELYLDPETELSDIIVERKALQESITGTKPLILIVDDNADVRRFIAGIIKEEYDFVAAAHGRAGLQKVEKHRPDLILCDVMMPEMDGPEFMKRVKFNPGLKQTPFVFLTARADVEMKVAGLTDGADDYIVKPFNSLELLARIKSLLRIRSLQQVTTEQKKQINGLTRKLEGKYSYGNILGNSPPMQAVYYLLENIKDTDAAVLITGETGTGKELVANAIHYNSLRKDRPMVSVNCGAIPKELMEREFFGHIKGAYTGAVESRRGYFEEAAGGTLFLDEIAELDKGMQAKLLRVLEYGEIMRVGDAAATKINVRLIAATSADLHQAVKKGYFRKELFYRLYVVPVNLPPLRQRGEDIPLLIEHFLKEFQSQYGNGRSSLNEREMNILKNYSYPGNVRELRHIIERYCLLGGAIVKQLQSTEESPRGFSRDIQFEEILSTPFPLKEARAFVEREIINHTLKMCNNNYDKTARQLNICLASLYNKLKEYEMN